MTYAAVGVSVRIGTATLLHDVSVEVAAGEIVAVAGPNGAGKTTLIAALAGDRRPSTGSVLLDGRALDDRPRGELARRRAVMGSEGSVVFGFSAREVVQLGRTPLHGGAPDAADRRITAELLDAVDCAHLTDRVFATLSTGERQRVQLARAIAQVTDADGVGSPERFLLLDEPTSSLDPAHQHTAMRSLRERADHGLGVLAVLHDLNLAAAYADRIVLMRDGRLMAVGTSADVMRADVLESAFDIPMLVITHPELLHPLAVARPSTGPPKIQGT